MIAALWALAIPVIIFGVATFISVVCDWSIRHHRHWWAGPAYLAATVPVAVLGLAGIATSGLMFVIEIGK